jgi:hypothetical protein
MPIISDKHVINISFKHVENDSQGKENIIDVNAFLEDSLIKVKLKMQGKTLVATLSSLKEIISYVENATKIASSDARTNEIVVPQTFSHSASKTSSLEKIIFNERNLISGANGPSEKEVATKNYASPTIIAMSGAISSAQVGDSSDEEVSVIVNPASVSAKGKAVKSKLRRVEALDLSVPSNIDEEGRISIDLDGESQEDSE